MARWVGAGGGRLWGDEEALKDVVPRQQDYLNDTWLDLDSGCMVLLASDGGWRDAENSSFRAFHRSPTGNVTDVTFALLRNVDNRYLTKPDHLGDHYTPVLRVCRNAINEILDVPDGYGVD